MRFLNQYSKNIYSQNGEDGILEKIISDLKLNTHSLTLCEFGAWDGKYLSNTFNLIEKYKAKAILIEGDVKKFNLLIETANDHPSITPINKMVSSKGVNSLDSILSNHDIHRDFDILSIDIDTYDLEIWEHLTNYLPKVVIIEINSGIGTDILQYHSDEKGKLGNSFLSTINVGITKKYTPIAHTGNLIFVKNEYLEKLNVPEEIIKNPKLLFNYDFIYTNATKNNYLYKLLNTIIPSVILKRIPQKVKSKIRMYLYKFNILNYFKNE